MPLKLNGQTFYNIGEACALAGTSRDTFLRWVRQGKFTDVRHRDRNGWRLFTDSDVQQSEGQSKSCRDCKHRKIGGTSSVLAFEDRYCCCSCCSYSGGSRFRFLTGHLYAELPITRE